MKSSTKFWVVSAGIIGLLFYMHQSQPPEQKRWCPGTRSYETVSGCFLLTATPEELDDAVSQFKADRRNDSYRGR